MKNYNEFQMSRYSGSVIVAWGAIIYLLICILSVLLIIFFLKENGVFLIYVLTISLPIYSIIFIGIGLYVAKFQKNMQTLSKLFEKLEKQKTSTQMIWGATHTLKEIQQVIDIISNISTMIIGKYLIPGMRYEYQDIRLWIQDGKLLMSEAIYDLARDLQKRLDNEIKTLEKTQQQIYQNLGEDVRLSGVVHKQQFRLDRQIEQFEELQRVLQKM